LLGGKEMSSRNKTHKARNFIIVTLIIIIALALTFFYFLRQNNSTKFDEETAKIGNIETYYSFSGVVEAKNRQNVMSEKLMQIEDIKVKEGDKVKKDDLLITTTQGDQIKASIDGEVSKIYFEKGAQIMSAARLMDIIDYDNLQITVKVDEYDLNCISIDKQVDVTLNAFDKKITGKISFISKEATNLNGVSFFTAAIDLTKDELLRVGMSAQATILNQKVTDVVTLSMKAIQFDNANKPYVLIKNDKGVPTTKYIETGINDGITAEIKQGLTSGDVVLYEKADITQNFGPRTQIREENNNSSR
jgi:multidrug efflux pump subunit AcrA (membrane-fusion protein)